MKSEFHNKDAIDFLSLVREDLEKIASVDTPHRAGVTARFSKSELETLASLPSFDSPLRLGRFKIIEQIGEGGFARVFVAIDPNLDREVALKVPKPHSLISNEARRRFEREGKSAAILSHPNIVPVFESGSAGPICFIASEYCLGTNLRNWNAESQKKSKPRTAVEIVTRLADAVQHAHRRGIIHRDLKPSNIIVVGGEEPVANRLRITDFGLAMQLSCEETLTAHGAVVGTPAYMSPEQAEGIGKVDHRTDVYSLGMILYELLTGSVPFKRSSHIASIAAVINEAVPPIRRINSRVDADLEAICLKALEKESDSRYQSAFDLKSDLQRWLKGEAVSVRKLSPIATACRWVGRNPWIASAILFGAVCLSVGFAFSFTQWKQAQANLVQSDKQRDRAERNVEELHDTIISYLEASIETLEKGAKLVPAKQKVLDKLMDAHLRLVEEEAEEVEVTPETFHSYERLSRIFRQTGRYEEAMEICERADKILKPFLGNKESRQKFGICAADIAREKGYILGDQGQPELLLAHLYDAEKFYLDAESASDRVIWLEEGFYLYRELAFTHFAARDKDNCRIAFEKSRSKAIEAFQLKPNDKTLEFNYAKSFCDISHLYRSTRGWQSSLECLERAEELLEQAQANLLSNPDVESEVDANDYQYRLAYIRYEMALYLRSKVGDFDRAEEYTLRAIESFKELTRENPGYLVYRNRLSHAYMRLINVYEDQELFDEVLQLIPVAEEAHLNGMPNWAAQRTAFGQITRGKIWAFEYHDPRIAEEAFDKAVKVIESDDNFDLSKKHMVDTLLKAHRQRELLYAQTGQHAKSVDAAAEGYRLAVQRAFQYPNDRSVNTVLHRGKNYAEKVFNSGNYGLSKTVMDTTAEACKDSLEAQYSLAKQWAKFDAMQKDTGVERKIWLASRNRSMQLLSRAIDLGFSNYERLKNERYFRQYDLLPEFEAACERIKPEVETTN